MKRLLLCALVISVFLVQVSALPAGLPFTKPASMYLLFEGLLLVLISFLWLRGGVPEAIFVAAVCQRFWALITHVSWGFSHLLHQGAGLLAGTFLLDFGFSDRGFRIGGVLVAADPAKTLAFPFLVFLFAFFFLLLVEKGFFPATKIALKSLATGSIILMMRWMIVSELLSRHDLDFGNQSWNLLYGAGLLFSWGILGLGFLIPRGTRLDFLNQTISAPDSGKKGGANAAGRTLGIPLRPPSSIKALLAWMACLSIVTILHNLNLDLGGTIRVLVDETHSSPSPDRFNQNAQSEAIVRQPIGSFTQEAGLEAELEPGFDDSHLLTTLGTVATVGRLILPADRMSPTVVSLRRLVAERLHEEILESEKPDLIVVGLPSKAFSPEEIRVYMRFVERGGTVWAWGDRQDRYFVNSHLRTLLASAGVRLGVDSIHDLGGGGLVTWGSLHAPIPWTPPFGSYSRPAGASVMGDIRMIPMMVSSPGVFSIPWQPGNPGFLGTAKPSPGDLCGPFILAAVAPFGNGKIIIQGDGAAFKTSSLFDVGKAGMIRTVVGSSRVPFQRAVMGIVVELLLGLLSGITLKILLLNCLDRYAAVMVGISVLYFSGSTIISALFT